jgi:methoxymalonate biosynthesis protein
VKCLVWDLDGTVWRGTLLESDDCRLRPGVRGVIAELDRRGVLQSVASRNDPDLALPLLRRKGLAGYFVQPQIGWDSKVRSLNAVSEALGVSLDAMARVDDEPFEC